MFSLQVFHLEVVLENRQQHMFGGEVIPQMFSNIKSIYQFHHDFVLPQLEKRMIEWYCSYLLDQTALFPQIKINSKIKSIFVEFDGVTNYHNYHIMLLDERRTKLMSDITTNNNVKLCFKFCVQ